jgi:hypothetical protein
MLLILIIYGYSEFKEASLKSWPKFLQFYWNVACSGKEADGMKNWERKEAGWNMTKSQCI